MTRLAVGIFLPDRHQVWWFVATVEQAVDRRTDDATSRVDVALEHMGMGLRGDEVTPGPDVYGSGGGVYSSGGQTGS